LDPSGQSRGKPISDVHHVDLAQRSIGSDHLGKLLAPGDPGAAELEGLGKELPLSIDEAEGGMDRDVRTNKSVTHRLDLPTEPVGKLGAVASIDVEVEVGLEPSTLVSSLYEPLIGLSVNDPDAGCGNRNVVNVPAGLGYFAVVEEDRSVTDTLGQTFCETSLPLRALCPCPN
jgi:hypothetical protein